ncbi:MAG: hypothetical protein AAF715_17245 [Myxococcota bacterium]
MRNLAFRTGLVGLTSALWLAWGCGGGSIDGGGSGGGGADSSGNATNSGGAGAADSGQVVTIGTGGTGQGGDDACAAVSQEADLVSRPVDIVFVIDNSGSMGDEIEEVEKQINANFATIINGANPPIDYRVIMVSAFGSFQSREICIAQPLGGVPDADMDGLCDSIPAAPVETMNFFHYDQRISSVDALCRLIDRYSIADQAGNHPMGWGFLLRQEAFKFIVVITDDRVICSNNGTLWNDNNTAADGQTVATQFDTALRTLDPAQFGADAMNRQYSFWSIISQQEFMTSPTDPLGEPVPPTEPITANECSPNLNPNKPGGFPSNPGTGYQALSIMTGGYRYPTCALDYTDLFTLMAQGVIDGAQVACEFEIPEPPEGETLDLDTVEVIYSSMGNEQATYTQVASEAACTPNGFYIADGTITLCPDACSVVQADEDAKLDLRFDCLDIVQ